jgi:MbtH protein
MNRTDSEMDEPKWTVLVNHEEQYSLWREDRPVPAGWQQVYGPAQESACVDYVERNWLDMRPKSIR